MINGKVVGKDREEYEPLIYPSSFILKSVGTGSTQIYVDTVRPLFNSEKEASTNPNKIDIISQDVSVGGLGTVTVSSSGTISSVNISNGGSGYTSIPSVIIGNPVGLGTEFRASATATITNGSVSGITVSNPGSGYTSTNPPSVIIEEKSTIKENEVRVTSYKGDYGTLVGFGVTTQSSQNKIIVDFYIPVNSFMRDDIYVGTGITVSGISTGDYFTLFNTNIGITTSGTVVSESTNGTVIGVTTTFLDNVYQVSSVHTEKGEIIGVGTTAVRRVFANIVGYSTVTFNNLSLSFDSTTFTFDSNTFDVLSGGISSDRNFGNFSWGKIELTTPLKKNSFNFYGDNGYSGISTSAIVTRSNPLKFKNYT